MIACRTNKKVYQTVEIAEDALLEANIKFERGPIAIYKCEDCGYYHLTSQGQMNEKLAAFIAAGKLKQQKEANGWLDKLKRKQ